jgi:uncharacterized membrane protein
MPNSTEAQRKAAYRLVSHRLVTLASFIVTLVAFGAGMGVVLGRLDPHYAELTLLLIPSMVVRILLMDARVLLELCKRFEFMYLVVQVGELPMPTPCGGSDE